MKKASPSQLPLVTVEVAAEQDVVSARQRARVLAALPALGYARGDHEEWLLALGADVVLHRLDERHQLLEAVARAVGDWHG
jgi:hypothetical protein